MRAPMNDNWSKTNISPLVDDKAGWQTATTHKTESSWSPSNSNYFVLIAWKISQAMHDRPKNFIVEICICHSFKKHDFSRLFRLNKGALKWGLYERDCIFSCYLQLHIFLRYLVESKRAADHNLVLQGPSLIISPWSIAKEMRAIAVGLLANIWPRRQLTQKVP